MLKAPRLRLITAAIAAISASMASMTSIAQQTPAPVIEEIIVTAQKRAQFAQDVPIALTAITSNEMDNAGITSFKSIQQGVSGVVMNALSGLMQPFIRGVGSFNAGAATSQSVAVYIDDVYLARANSSLKSTTILAGSPPGPFKCPPVSLATPARAA